MQKEVGTHSVFVYSNENITAVVCHFVRVEPGTETHFEIYIIVELRELVNLKLRLTPISGGNFSKFNQCQSHLTNFPVNKSVRKTQEKRSHGEENP